MLDIKYVKNPSLLVLKDKLSSKDFVSSLKKEFNTIYEDYAVSEVFLPFITSKSPSLDVSIVVDSAKMTLEMVTNILCTHIFISTVYPGYKADGKLNINLVEKYVVHPDTRVHLSKEYLESYGEEGEVLLPTVQDLLNTYKTSKESKNVLDYIKTNVNPLKLEDFSFNTNLELNKQEVILISSDSSVNIQSLLESDIIVTDSLVENYEEKEDTIVIDFSSILPYSAQLYLIDYVFGERYAKELLSEDNLLYDLDYSRDIEKAVAYVNTFETLPDSVNTEKFFDMASDLVLSEEGFSSYEVYNSLILTVLL